MSMDRRLKMRHLHCFMALVQSKSTVRAAEELNTTQPVISRTIREMEGILGVELFDRARRGAVLTPDGLMFHRNIAPALGQIGEVTSRLQDRLAQSSRLALGALPNVCASLLPGVVSVYKKRNPGMQIEIHTGTSRHLLALLQAGTVSAVFGRLAPNEDMKRLSFEFLYSEPLRFVCRPDHPLAGATDFTIGKLRDYTLLLPLTDTTIRTETDRFLISQGLGDHPNVIETISFDFARRFLDMEDAVWVVPDGIVAEDLARGRLAQLPPSDSTLSGPVGITIDPARDMPAGLKDLLDVVREACLKQDYA